MPNGDDPDDQYPLYPRGMLIRHGLDRAVDLASVMGGWTEEELRAAFWPAYAAIRQSDIELERCWGIDGGEVVSLLNGHPIYVSEDRWAFQVLAGSTLIEPIAAAMRRQRTG